MRVPVCIRMHVCGCVHVKPRAPVWALVYVRMSLGVSVQKGIHVHVCLHLHKSCVREHAHGRGEGACPRFGPLHFSRGSEAASTVRLPQLCSAALEGSVISTS